MPRWPGPDLGVAPWQGHVDGTREAREACQLEYGERLADLVELAGTGEYCAEPLGLEAIDLDVEVLDGTAQQRVPNSTPDHVRPASGVSYLTEQGLQARRNVESERTSDHGGSVARGPVRGPTHADEGYSLAGTAGLEFRLAA